jgi:hypothetical protein
VEDICFGTITTPGECRLSLPVWPLLCPTRPEEFQLTIATKLTTDLLPIKTILDKWIEQDRLIHERELRKPTQIIEEEAANARRAKQRDLC